MISDRTYSEPFLKVRPYTEELDVLREEGPSLRRNLFFIESGKVMETTSLEFTKVVKYL